MTAIVILMLQINCEHFSTTASYCTPQCTQILPDSMVSIMLLIPFASREKLINLILLYTSSMYPF